jgi:hypothetical protein
VPEAMVAYLDNHGPEKFATIFLGKSMIHKVDFLCYGNVEFYEAVEHFVADPHYFDANPDPGLDPAFHFDEDPNPDPTFHSDANPDPDPIFQFDEDPHPTTHLFLL